MFTGNEHHIAVQKALVKHQQTQMSPQKTPLLFWASQHLAQTRARLWYAGEEGHE